MAGDKVFKFNLLNRFIYLLFVYNHFYPKMSYPKALLVVCLMCFGTFLSFAQKKAYFIDGFHGGIWGHYPKDYTSYVIELLEKNPNWAANLEIEPETWERDLKENKDSFRTLQQYLNNPNSRVEYVNPAYGQPYMFNISGESIIKHFDYGIRSLKGYFPGIVFNTYSSEEPCFTSSLPQILKSFGFKYASLKNPNTCWGGYTAAHGQDLVNWVGPDGTSIITSPRYNVESLKAKSTWETIGNANSTLFISKAFADGIKYPIGMCLQDAGWRHGSWLKGNYYEPSVYTTWRNYFENVAKDVEPSNWNVSQEDIKVSLVWGSQILQKIAQQVKQAETILVQAEKIASMEKLENGIPYPKQLIDKAWRTLMLAQHHDCWIVPYNGKPNDTWADKVKTWTDNTIAIAEQIIGKSYSVSYTVGAEFIKVYNTASASQEAWVKISIPQALLDKEDIAVVDHLNAPVPFQVMENKKAMMFKAKVPAFGYRVYKLVKSDIKKDATASARIYFEANGDCFLETDLYKVHIDKKSGGTVKSLIAKKLNMKEFVDNRSQFRFNQLRGNFYKKGGFKTNIETPANITVVESGPKILKIKIENHIANNPVSQYLTLKQGDPMIDCSVRIDWKENEGIGEFEEKHYADTALHKAFYNDKYKLLTIFPLNLKGQKVFKDAPFDITKSNLQDTFFSRWDSIKNNVLFNWVDVIDEKKEFGMALFSDHVTSYVHGEEFPLALNTQYSGKGLWGRNYSLKGATIINYRLLPHKNDWREMLVEENASLSNPLQVVHLKHQPSTPYKSFLESSVKSLKITSCVFEGDSLIVRFFNEDNQANNSDLNLSFAISNAALIALNGKKISDLKISSMNNKSSLLKIASAPFGLSTIRISTK